MLNTRRERGAEDHKVEGMSEEEIAELGDESYVFSLEYSYLDTDDTRPRYKYTI